MPFFVFELLVIDQQSSPAVSLPSFDVTWPLVSKYGFHGVSLLLIGILTILVTRVAVFAFRWWAAGSDEEGKHETKEHLALLRNYILVLLIVTIGISVLRRMIGQEL